MYYAPCLAFVCLECSYLLLDLWHACLAVNFDNMLIRKNLSEKSFSGRVGGGEGGGQGQGLFYSALGGAKT